MPSVCFYFQVHQPYRLKRYSVFDLGKSHQYFDYASNAEIMRKVARKCYLPTNAAMLGLIERFQGKFKISYSISGVAIEQMEQYAPEVLKSFRELADTGCVEFLGETYYHSLAAIYDEEEFKAQVAKHSAVIQECFGKKPAVFRNTELIYNDQIGSTVRGLGFRAMITEGADDILGWRNPNFLYQAPETDLVLLLKNYRLSDDVAFRFSNQGWKEYPLNAPKFASWIHQLSGNGDTVNLFMDYETFGEHQWESTGIFEFLDRLPAEILKKPDWMFLTPSEVVERYSPAARLSFPRTVSWADVDRDLTAWQGNSMQQGALRRIYELGDAIRLGDNPSTLELWRKLQTSDHFYYMCTKWFADGDVHAYFSPYKSPYDAFIAYMNVLTDFKQMVSESSPIEERV